jgi:hypothetical protein
MVYLYVLPSLNKDIIIIMHFFQNYLFLQQYGINAERQLKQRSKFQLVCMYFVWSFGIIFANIFKSWGLNTAEGT